MTNVINLSEYKKQRLDKISGLEENVIEMNKKIAMRFSVDVAHDVVSAMSELGFDVTQNYETVLDIMSLIETIRALIFRSVGEDYHYQNVSERVFADSDIDLETSLMEFLDDMEDDDEPA